MKERESRVLLAYEMHQQEAFAQMLDDAIEELAIEDARDEIRRNL